jgi:hypothetical protein
MSMKLTITNTRPIDCSTEPFPPTVLWAQVRIFDIVPADSAVLVYTPKTGNRPVRFDGPETTANVPVDPRPLGVSWRRGYCRAGTAPGDDPPSRGRSIEGCVERARWSRA